MVMVMAMATPGQACTGRARLLVRLLLVVVGLLVLVRAVLVQAVELDVGVGVGVHIGATGHCKGWQARAPGWGGMQARRPAWLATVRKGEAHMLLCDMLCLRLCQGRQTQRAQWGATSRRRWWVHGSNGC
jgi:hypothetical protein